MDIPTMETGCEVAKRAYTELTDIQVHGYMPYVCTYIRMHMSIHTCIQTHIRDYIAKMATYVLQSYLNHSQWLMHSTVKWDIY